MTPGVRRVKSKRLYFKLPSPLRPLANASRIKQEYPLASFMSGNGESNRTKLDPVQIQGRFGRRALSENVQEALASTSLTTRQRAGEVRCG